MMGKLETVTIVHGKGTGAVRSAMERAQRAGEKEEKPC